MKKTILGLGVLFVMMTLAGCGATVQEPSTNGSANVTKKEVNDTQKKLQEVKAEVLKVQMDETLSKEQKAKKIEALQAEIQDQVNSAVSK